ncbi:MAG: hypothetical protein ACREM1_22980, partial [Longimicrobiales bacterium]
VEYDDAELDAWAARIHAQPWREVYVFFKHVDDGPPPAAFYLLSQWKRLGGEIGHARLSHQ